MTALDAWINLIVNLDKSNIVVFRKGGFLTKREKCVFNCSELKVVLPVY